MTGVQTFALPICQGPITWIPPEPSSFHQTLFFLSFVPIGKGVQLAKQGTGWVWKQGVKVTNKIRGKTPIAPKLALDVASLVGKQATVAPHLPAGSYTALVVNGKVYVARMHDVAWELAGRKGVTEFYGYCEIDVAGKVVRLFK